MVPEMAQVLAVEMLALLQEVLEFEIFGDLVGGYLDLVALSLE